jgi:hypothetical protein
MEPGNTLIISGILEKISKILNGFWGILRLYGCWNKFWQYINLVGYNLANLFKKGHIILKKGIKQIFNAFEAQSTFV